MSVKFAIAAALSLAVTAMFAATPAKPAPAAAPVNLMKNGSFEKGSEGWTSWGAKGAKTEILKNVPSAGKNAARFTAEDFQKPLFFINTVSGVKGDKKYEVSCRIKGKAVSADLYIFLWGKNNKWLDEKVACSIKLSDKWTTVKGTFLSKKGSEKFNVGIRLKKGSVEATDFIVKEVK